MARGFVEERAIRTGSVALTVIENPPLPLALPFGSFGLLRHAFDLFGVLLPLLLRVATAIKAEQDQPNNSERVHAPRSVHCLSSPLRGKSLTT